MIALRRSEQSENIFFVLSVIGACLSLVGITYWTYAVFALLVLGAVSKNVSSDKFITLCLFLPNRYLQLIGVFLFCCLKGYIIPRKLPKDMTVFLLFILLVSTANCVMYQGLWLQTVFQFFVYYCILLLIWHGLPELNTHIVYRLLDKMFILQVITCTIQLLYFRNDGDELTGTMFSAHYVGVFLIIYCFILWGRLKEEKKLQTVFVLCVALVFLYLVDAKHIVGMFVVAVIFDWLMRKLHIRNRITFTLFALFAIIGAFILISSSNVLSDRIRSNLYQIYVMNTNYNKKYLFFSRMFNQLISLNGIFGFGIGQYGSQIAITMGKAAIYPWDPSIAAYHYIAQPYREAIEGLMTQTYTQSGIGLSSMVMGYPLVSYSAILGELGILGYFMFGRLFDKYLKNYRKTFVVFFFLISPFDTYFEIPCVFILILLVSELMKVKASAPAAKNSYGG